VQRGIAHHGCIYCSKQKVLSGITDLATVNPELAKEWHPIKNGILQPCDVMPHSAKKVWWLGACGHEWEASISSRTAGNGCPFCSGRKVLSGFNDLATVAPELLSDWNYDKNIGIIPEQIAGSSNKKVWWRCSKCEYEWQAPIARRKQGHGCPYCGGHIVREGYNDLMTVAPNIASQWDYSKNKDKIPNKVAGLCGSYFWWKCKQGHEWRASVASRVYNNSGCPYCSGRRV
jgi:DNA-directed RNA polymerase subunit RPC12/RpoP